MAARIEFIAPVEAIRGNMSGKQDLRYAEHDNKAYEGPIGSRNYAKNYTPRFIGAKIASTGRKYFMVKTKTASRLTTRSLKAMALLGGAGAIYASMLKRKDLTPYTSMLRLYNYNVAQTGYTGTFRRFVMDFLRNGLQNKVQNFTANVASISVSFKNPWYDGSMTDGASVKQTLLVKFWEQLAPNGFKFKVGNQIGIAQTGDSWEDIYNSNYNILHVESYDATETCMNKRTIAGEGTVCNLIKFEGVTESFQNDVVANREYEMGDEVPWEA